MAALLQATARCPTEEGSSIRRIQFDSAQGAAMRKLYTSIQDSVHVAGSHSFLVTASPGFAVNPKEFENAFSPNNPNGNLSATEIFSEALCDPSPYLQAIFGKQGSVSDWYGLLVGGAAVTENSTTANSLKEWMADFQKSRFGSPTNPGHYYHPCYPEPANWFDASSGQWTAVSTNFKDLNASTDSDFDKFGGAAMFSRGLWSEGGKFGNCTCATEHISSTLQVALSFSYQRVQLMRPWLHEALFRLGGFRLGTFPPASFSNGYLAPNNTNAFFPLLPSSMIVVKDVTIVASLSSTEQQIVANSQHGQAAAWGPFSLSRGTTYETGAVKIPGIQVLGYICDVLPLMPPEIYECVPICRNDGECAHRSTGNICICKQGWQGAHCEVAYCSKKCENGGSCDEPNHCKCPIGWIGKQCETPACPAPGCKNGGKCVGLNRCECLSGWRGTHCEEHYCNFECPGQCIGPNLCECCSVDRGNSCAVGRINAYCNDSQRNCEGKCKGHWIQKRK